jgi:hypothetical protein
MVRMRTNTGNINNIFLVKYLYIFMLIKSGSLVNTEDESMGLLILIISDICREL